MFAVDSYAGGPLAITEVAELRQQNPPSLWAVSVRNRSSERLASFTLAAAIVAGDGTVKTIQRLPAIKHLKPNQASRRELRVTATVLTPTDRVVFFVSDLSHDGADAWKAEETEVGALIKAARAKTAGALNGCEHRSFPVTDRRTTTCARMSACTHSMKPRAGCCARWWC